MDFRCLRSSKNSLNDGLFNLPQEKNKCERTWAKQGKVLTVLSMLQAVRSYTEEAYMCSSVFDFCKSIGNRSPPILISPVLVKMLQLALKLG